jgi:hypothetical protein
MSLTRFLFAQLCFTLKKLFTKFSGTAMILHGWFVPSKIGCQKERRETVFCQIQRTTSHRYQQEIILNIRMSVSTTFSPSRPAYLV